MPAPATLAPIDNDLVVSITALVQSTAKAPKSATGTTKFTADVLTRVFAALRTGHTVTDACLYAGINIATYEDWVSKGRKGEQPFARFCEVIERLNVAAYSHAVVCFSEAAKTDPKVAERFLARRAKKEWGTHEDSNVGGPVTVQIGTFLLEGSPSED